MFYTKKDLPDDNATLKSICIELLSQNDLLEQQLRLARGQRFGASSESTRHPGMKPLFSEEQTPNPQANTDDREQVEVKAHKKKVGRKPIPDDLSREDVVLDIKEDDRKCACCGEQDSLKKVSEQISEKLHVEPAKAVVKRYIRPVYSCKKCETMKVELMPAHPIPSCSVTPETIAHIAVSKYVDAMPLYRQEQMLLRQGAEISRSNMARWMIQVSEQLKPLKDLLHKDLLAGGLLLMDESSVQVLKEKGRTPTSKSYMLVQARGDPDGKKSIVLFHYNPSRSKEAVETVLQGYSGIFMTDGLGVYDSLCSTRNELVHVGCWQHVRRKFTDALKGLKASQKKDSLSLYAVKMIDRLFAVEKKAKLLSSKQRYDLRQADSKPVIDELDQWLTRYQEAVPQTTQTGKALKYFGNQWSKLIKFLDNGDIPLHNNFTENMIRPFAVGRKNWLFSDKPEGAEASATLYSLLSTAKLNGLDPYRYLSNLLIKIPKAHSESELRALLPYGDLQKTTDS